MENTVIHCTTQKEYDEVMRIFNNKGWVWCDRESLININYFNRYNHFCVTYKNYCNYSDKDYYTRNNYKVLTFKEFKNMENGMKYKVGDFIASRSDTRKILAVCDLVYIISSDDNFDRTGVYYTQFELDQWGYKLKQESKVSQLIEVTLEEVAKLKGIDVSQLRIKE